MPCMLLLLVCQKVTTPSRAQNHGAPHPEVINGLASILRIVQRIRPTASDRIQGG